MPWYRIFASHGPGHQSSTEFYRFFEKPLDTKEKRKDAWEEEFAYNYDWPIGDVELCDRLPQHVHDQKVSNFEATIDNAYKMLRVLRETPTKPVIAVRFEIITHPSNPPVTGFQARLLEEPNVQGPLREKREDAVNALLQMFRRENRKVVKAKKGATRYSRRSDYAVITR